MINNFYEAGLMTNRLQLTQPSAAGLKARKSPRLTRRCGAVSLAPLRANRRYHYDVFGNNYTGSLAGSNALGYGGKRYDPATSFYDYGFRDYDTSSGRFTTADPIRDGVNWYVYCNNDPVNFFDLWGLFTPEREASIQKHLNEAYVKGDNDCDAWLQKVELEAYPESTLKETWGDAAGFNAKDHHEKLSSELKSEMKQRGDYIVFQSLQPKDDKGNGISEDFMPVHSFYASLNEDGSVDVGQCTKNPEGKPKDYTGPGYSQIVHYQSQEKFLKDGWGKLEFYRLDEQKSNKNNEKNGSAQESKDTNNSFNSNFIGLIYLATILI